MILMVQCDVNIVHYHVIYWTCILLMYVTKDLVNVLHGSIKKCCCSCFIFL